VAIQKTKEFYSTLAEATVLGYPIAAAVTHRFDPALW